MTDGLFGPPIGYTQQGDMTPFTDFTPSGDWIALRAGPSGDVLHPDFVSHTSSGDMTPFLTNAQGERIPGMAEMWRQSASHVSLGAASAAPDLGAVAVLLLP